MLIRLLTIDPVLFFTLAAALLLALSLHEFAHAFMANRLGDATARLSGRLTLNPLAHLDPVGTLLLFFAGFGWAKPVPVNSLNLDNPKRDMALVSLAGPLSNFLLAVLSALLFHFFGFQAGLIGQFLYYFAFYNAVLGVFNLLPISPLDGFKVVSGILPHNLAVQWEQLAPYGMFILLFLIFTDVLGNFLFSVVGFVLRILGLPPLFS